MSERPEDSVLAHGSHAMTLVGAMIESSRRTHAIDGALRGTPSAPLPGDGTRALTFAASESTLPAHRTLSDVIASRRSGTIVPDRVSRATFAALLAAIRPPPAGPLHPAPELAPLVFPVVLDVEGVPPGAYRHDRDARSIAPIGTLTRDRLCDEMLLQREHGTGAALFFFVAPLASWLQRFGDRGYRGAVMSVGWMTDRAYLAAELLGLTYTATGGFAPAAIDAALGLDGYEHSALFAFAVGGSRRSREGR